MFARWAQTCRKRGATAVVVATCIPVILGFAALTIDMGYLYNVKIELQNAADAAALACASGLPEGVDEAHARAMLFAHKNAADKRSVALDVNDVQAGVWDFPSIAFTSLADSGVAIADACRVTATLNSERGSAVDLFFGGIFGKRTTDLSASATAAFATGEQWDVVIVQDVTGSFKNDIDDARLADQALLDCIRDHSGAETQVALVAFTGFPFVLSPLENIDTSYDAISAAVSSLDECGSGSMPACSGTNIAAGLTAAVDLLTSSESELPPAIVLVSDGEPASSSKGPKYSTAQLKELALQAADDADSNGISIFTLFFSDGGSNSGAEFLASLVRGKGTAHETPDADAMEIELLEICLEGLPLTLVE